MAEAVYLKKGNHCSVWDRQFLERFVQFFPKLMEVGIAVGTPFIRQLLKDLRICPVLVEFFQAEKAAQAVLPEVAERRVDGDLVKPGEERAVALEAIDGLKGLDEGVLGEVGGVLAIGGLGVNS